MGADGRRRGGLRLGERRRPLTGLDRPVLPDAHAEAPRRLLDRPAGPAAIFREHRGQEGDHEVSVARSLEPWPLRVDDSDVDRQPAWAQSSSTFQPPPRLATRLVRWLVVILIVGAAYGAYVLIAPEPSPRFQEVSSLCASDFGCY